MTTHRFAVEGVPITREGAGVTTHRLEIDGDRVVVDEYGPTADAGAHHGATAHDGATSHRSATAHGVAVAQDVAVAHDGSGGGDAIVLLHGFTGDRTSWAGVARELATTHRVLVPDLPGHGETRVRADAGDGARYDLGHATWLLDQVVHALEVDRFTLIGYSMGGRLALHAALALPGRIARVVLESASPGLQTAEERAERRAADEELARFIETRPIEDFVARWESLPLFATQRTLDAATRAEVRRRRLACRPEGLAASLRGMGTGAQPWLGGRLGELGMPVLLVAGERDAKFVSIAREMLRSLAGGPPYAIGGAPYAADGAPGAVRGAPHPVGGALRIVPGAGHDVHLEAPAAFLDVVRDFLLEGGLACRSSG